VLLEGALAPGFKLVGERLVEVTVRTGSDPHQGLGHFSYFVGACPCHEHLRVEVTFPVSGHVSDPRAGPKR
jgi:hypothetical protein